MIRNEFSTPFNKKAVLPADSVSIPSGKQETLASLEWQYTNEEGTSMRLGDADLPPLEVIR